MAAKSSNLSSLPISELIRERARVLSDIRKFEKEDLPSDAWFNDPSPDTIYLQNLETLSRICNLISEKYRSEHNK